MRENDGHSAGTVFLSFIFGGIVGAGLAMLLAPQSGSDTRKRIKEFADDMREKAEDYVEHIKKGVTSTVDEGKGFYDEKKSAITAAVEAGKKAYEKEKDRLSKG
ncbi:MAG: YtxH domain-containing protein [Nitrospiraceae bacterium]|nr:MAG: YtxH domain-containing protein [Nitrospiraceae bacterium]